MPDPVFAYVAAIVAAFLILAAWSYLRGLHP
jgi:hypothetical protein